MNKTPLYQILEKVDRNNASPVNNRIYKDFFDAQIVADELNASRGSSFAFDVQFKVVEVYIVG